MDRVRIPRRPRLPRPLFAAAMVAATAVLPAAALATEPELAASPGDDSELVLVEVDPAAPTPDKREVRERLGVAARDVTIHANGWRAYRLDEPQTADEVRREIAGVPGAGNVEVAQEVRALAVPNDPSWGSLWGLGNIGASAAWDDQGSPAEVVVAVTDTGVQTDHPDLANVLWTNADEVAGNGLDDDGNGYVDDVGGWDFRDDDASVYDDANDDHGTHVAGTIAAERNNSVGIAGVTDNATIMPLKFLGGPSGSGSTSDAIAAIDYAVANGAKVVNASWGGGYSQAVCDAVAAANSAGVVVVSAAGNGGFDGIGDNVNGNVASPASCSSAGNITVAAIGSGNDLAGFSNYGNSSTDLGAPGVGILSAVPGGGYSSWSGTSMATPHVAGAAALLLGLEPTLTPAQVEARIRDTGVSISSLAGATVSGKRLNLDNLVDSATADPNSPGPPGLASPAHGALLSASSATFDWSAPADAGGGIAGYDLEVDGSVVATTSAGVTHATAPLGDGTHTWTVVAKGAVAEDTPAGEMRSVVVDTTPPRAFSVVVPSSTDHPRPTISWQSTDATSGIAGYSVRLDDRLVATGGPSFRWHTPTSDLVEGAHTVSVIATDAAGHSRTASATFTYAPPPPESPDEAEEGTTEPAPRQGRVVARKGRIHIPVGASGVKRRVRAKGKVSRGRRTTARFSRNLVVRADNRFLKVKVPQRILRKKGRLVIRWRARTADFERWYARTVPKRITRKAIRQQRRIAAKRRAKRAAAKREAARRAAARRATTKS